MPKIEGAHAITRDGSNIILEYTGTASSTVRVVMNAANVSTLVEEETDFLSLIAGDLTYTVDYTQSTSHSSASVEDYAMDISILTRAGIVDETNTTTATLLAGATYTGTYLDVTGFSQFTVIYGADVIGTIHMDLSADGITALRTKTVPDVTGGAHTLAVVSKFMRVRWVNGATNQASFTLQTIYHISKSNSLTSTMNQVVSNANDVTLVRDPTIALWDTAREIYSGRTVEHFLGVNDAVGTTWTDIYPSGTHDYPFQL